MHFENIFKRFVVSTIVAENNDSFLLTNGYSQDYLFLLSTPLVLQDNEHDAGIKLLRDWYGLGSFVTYCLPSASLLRFFFRTNLTEIMIIPAKLLTWCLRLWSDLLEEYKRECSL